MGRLTHKQKDRLNSLTDLVLGAVVGLAVGAVMAYAAFGFLFL